MTETLEQRVNRLAEPGTPLDMVVDYCLTAGPPWCYQQWPREILKEYLAFHALHSTLAWSADISGARLQVTAAAVAWQTNEKRIRRRQTLGRHAFDWKPTDPNGDSLFLADFIGSEPGAIRKMLDVFDKRFPEWRYLKQWTYRKGRLVRLNGTRFARIYFPQL